MRQLLIRNILARMGVFNMVINENGLITENQNTPIQKQTANEELKQNNLPKDNFDFESNNQTQIDTYEEKIQIQETEDATNDLNVGVQDVQADSTLEDSAKKETVETNCLALTVRKDYNFAIAKNTVFKTIRIRIKVAISTFVLNIIKLFF